MTLEEHRQALHDLILYASVAQSHWDKRNLEAYREYNKKINMVQTELLQSYRQLHEQLPSEKDPYR